MFAIVLAFVLFMLPSCNFVVTNGVDTTTNSGDDNNDFVEDQTWSNTVIITWTENSATVSELPEGVSVVNENGYVTITSTAKHIEYMASGEGKGQLKFYSDYKFKLSLSDLILACADGPAVNNQSSKSMYLVLSGSNVLSDATTYKESAEDQKAALFSEGQILVSGDGTLDVTGNCKHAIASDDYIRVREGELTLKSNAADGMHANDGIIINGGLLSINAASEGIQCDTSSVVISGGEISIVAAGDKGILAYSSIDISGGTISVKSVDKGIKSKAGNITISGGNISVTTTGDDGKGVLAKLGQFSMSDGVLTVNTSGSSAKGIKSVGDMTISGGTITVVCSGSSSSSGGWFAPPGGGGGPGGGGPGGGNESSGPEGIESKAALTITGGIVYAQSSDDAINSGGDLTISGGYVCAYSTGNDGLDANGDCIINGGVVYAIAAGSPEVGIDANSEQNKKLYVKGGTVIAIGGLERGSSISTKSTSVSWSKNTWYALYSGNDLAFVFKTPASGGNSMTLCTSSSPTVSAGVSVSGGTALFNGMANINGTVTK